MHLRASGNLLPWQHLSYLVLGVEEFESLAKTNPAPPHMHRGGLLPHFATFFPAGRDGTESRAKHQCKTKEAKVEGTILN